MKIMHYINNLGAGGAEKLLTEILPIMQAKGHKTHLVYSNNKKNFKEFDHIISQNGIIVHNFNMSYYNPLQVLKLIRLIRTQEYDILHAHLFPTQYWLAIASLWKSPQTKFIKTEHSVFNRRKRFKILIPLEKWIYSRYNIIVAISNAVKENLLNWLNKELNILVINNGINLSQMELMKKSKTSVESSFFDPGKYNILMVGRFVSEKDQESLVKAISLLPVNYELYFIGEGYYMDEIKHLVDHLNLKDRVQFLGLRADVYKLMSMANLNVLSTNHEGFSGVALEAMASGRPFIGSDVEGVNDVVPDNLFLFPRKNHERLAAKIEEISNNTELETYLIERGLVHVKKFDISFMVENYLRAYVSLYN